MESLGQLSSSGIVNISKAAYVQGLPCSSTEAESIIPASVVSFFLSWLGRNVLPKGALLSFLRI